MNARLSSYNDVAMHARLRHRRVLGALVFVAVATVLIWPLLVNIALHAQWHDAFIAESSVFSLDRARYFHDILQNKSLYIGGEYSVLPMSYAIWYGLWTLLATVMPDATAYLVLIIIFYLLAYYFLVELLFSLSGDAARTLSHILLACLLALLYLSSLSLFNYIKSNIFFTLPYLVLPPLLYFALRYLRTGLCLYLLPYLILGLVLSDLNLAHVGILLASIIGFALLIVATSRPSCSFLRLLPLVLLLLPPATYAAGIAMGNALYRGSLSTFAVLAAENMYSNNATYLNIFTQTTDWGLFGSWKNVPYYAFSVFYSDGRTLLFGLLPYVLLAYACVISRTPAAKKKLAIGIVIAACVVFWLMLGDNNPVYHALYTHVVPFRIFRNITKLAPLLFLLIVLATYILLHDTSVTWKKVVPVAMLIIGALIYNVPFWTYAPYFFQDRTVEMVPQYWREAAAYLNSELNPNSRILALPAIYINDIYVWNGKETWVQGSLLDVLAKNESYRLSECCLGSAALEMDARKTFVSSNDSIRHLDTDYSRLSSFVRKYRFDYVVLTDDLVSEYQKGSDIRSWLARSGYRLTAAFGPVSVYNNPKNFALPFSGPQMVVERATALNYRLRFHGIRQEQAFVFDSPFNAGWELRPDDLHETAATKRPLEVFAEFLKPRVPGVRHEMGTNDTNFWMLSAKTVEAKFPHESFHVNNDGSVDLAARLYFRPEIYVLTILGAAVALFFVSFAALTVAALTQWKIPRVGFRG